MYKGKWSPAIHSYPFRNGGNMKGWLTLESLGRQRSKVFIVRSEYSVPFRMKSSNHSSSQGHTNVKTAEI